MAWRHVRKPKAWKPRLRKTPARGARVRFRAHRGARHGKFRAHKSAVRKRVFAAHAKKALATRKARAVRHKAARPKNMRMTLYRSAVAAQVRASLQAQQR